MEFWDYLRHINNIRRNKEEINEKQESCTSDSNGSINNDAHTGYQPQHGKLKDNIATWQF